jgi:TonB-dependent SusC/RagA subfamily outer membrane receptor
MPELPEVNTVMRGFHKTVLHIPVEHVEVHDSKIIRNASRQEFIEAISGHTFVDTYRQGKYFFGILENGIEIRIRGSRSLVGNNEPLFVLDGAPVGSGYNSASSVDVNMVQSIRVLPGGQAAIYGARGANGVILITTKK